MSKLAEAQRVLSEIAADVHAFREHCVSAGYTDTGDAWDLLEYIRDRALDVLPQREKA